MLVKRILCITLACSVLMICCGNVMAEGLGMMDDPNSGDLTMNGECIQEQLRDACQEGEGLGMMDDPNGLGMMDDPNGLGMMDDPNRQGIVDDQY